MAFRSLPRGGEHRKQVAHQQAGVNLDQMVQTKASMQKVCHFGPCSLGWRTRIEAKRSRILKFQIWSEQTREHRIIAPLLPYKG